MVAAPEHSPVCYQIGDLTLNINSRSVARGGQDLRIGGLTFDLLLALAESAPSMASYDYLADRVWQGRAVSPGTIAQRAKLLRTAISDDATSPRYFELVRGQGYRMVVDVQEVSGESRKRRPGRWIAAATAAVAATALVLAGYVMTYPGLHTDRARSSVAVLPFEDLSENGDQQYLADGLAEELINELTTLDRLEVASRSESFAFRGRDASPQEVGAALNVSAIVEGSVRMSGDAIRITVQLSDTEDGFHIWSQSFDSDTEDIFNTQVAIAKSVVGALGVKLGVGGANEFHGAGTRNFDAYEAFLRRDYEKAIELDPNYAAAWARQGFSIASSVWAKLPSEAPQIIERADPYLAKALQLDPNSAQVHADYAALSYGRMEWDIAEQAFARALELDRSAGMLTRYGNMMMLTGRARKAVDIYEKADALRRTPWPTRSAAMYFRSKVHIALQQIDAARQQTALMHPDSRQFNLLTIALNFGSASEVRSAIEALPQGTPDYSLLYATLVGLLDDREAAIEFLLELANDPTRAWPYKYESIALLLAYLGEPQQALEVFMNELQYTSIRYGSLWFPVMSDVRQLPEFREFLLDIGLVSYWRTYGWSNFCRPIGDEDFVCD